MNQPYGPSTRSVHGVPRRRTEKTPVSTPIYQSSTFVNAIGSQDEVLYTRYGVNPTSVEAASRLASLEGAEAALLLASGMGATALALLSVLRPGDHLLSSAWIYGGTRQLFEQEFKKLGISVSYVDPDRVRDWKRERQENTRAIFVETPTNPLMRVIDIDPLARTCAQQGLVLVVDSTFATPINFRPLEHGADLVIHSATKYLNGHSDVIAGGVAGNAELIEEIRGLLKVWGQSIDPHTSWLIERGMKTLAVRMERHNANGVGFARWAAQHDKITAVHHPGLDGHPDHEAASRLLNGFGGMVGLQIKGGGKAADAVCEKLTVATHAPSLGGVETLVSQPRYTSHAAMTVNERRAQGFGDGFIRVSVGIEDLDDIIDDFDRALG